MGCGGSRRREAPMTASSSPDGMQAFGHRVAVSGDVFSTDFGAVAAQHHRGQDVFVIMPAAEALPSAFLLGVFDGHGEGGQEAADAAALHLPQAVALALRSVVKAPLTPASAPVSPPRAPPSRALPPSGTLSPPRAAPPPARAAPPPPSPPPSWASAHASAFGLAFTEYQASCSEAYNEAVAAPMAALMAVCEEANLADKHGGLLLPHEGGSTATIMALVGARLSVGWVGDSRCVVATKLPGSARFEAVLITSDHNTGNSVEVERAMAAGGTTTGVYLAVPGAEGLVQVTRSLGDCAFHNHGVVSAVPDVISTELDPQATHVVIAGSDGFWSGVPLEDALAAASRALAPEDEDDIRSPISHRNTFTSAEWQSPTIKRTSTRRGQIAPVDVVSQMGETVEWNATMRLADALEKRAHAAAQAPGAATGIDDITVAAVLLTPSI